MDIPALPFCHIALKAKKTIAYDLLTLDDHIKKARIEQQLDQGNVAAFLQVNEGTLSKWETEKSQPLVKYWPAIMNFLGYCPYEEANLLVIGCGSIGCTVVFPIERLRRSSMSIPDQSLAGKREIEDWISDRERLLSGLSQIGLADGHGSS